MSGASLDKSTCTTVFTATDQTNGSLHDFALGDVELIGTSTRPANGTYTYPYIILKNTFTIKAEYERGGTTYYVKKSGSACDAVSTTSPAEECTDSLTQFNQAGNCDGEYLGARFSGGSLNGYLMRASDLDKRDANGTSISDYLNIFKACKYLDIILRLQNPDILSWNELIHKMKPQNPSSILPKKYF